MATVGPIAEVHSPPREQVQIASCSLKALLNSMEGQDMIKVSTRAFECQGGRCDAPSFVPVICLVAGRHITKYAV